MTHYRHLTQEKRYMLSRLLQEHFSQRKVAMMLDVAHSTILREVKRNSNEAGYYRHDHAQRQSERCREACRKRPVLTEALQKQIIEKLNIDWSPEQISGRFRRENISPISHQSIYNWLWKDRQSGGQLYRQLRRKRKYRAHKTKATHIVGRRMIDERPAVVDSRERFGDWELDSVIPRKGDPSLMITAVERKSRYLIASLVEKRDSYGIGRRICRMMNSAHTNPVTLTSDNGTEFATHSQVSRRLKCDFFFARPYHPWERGTNENTNGLIRQYMPSGTAFNMDRHKLHHAVERINNRPRKCLGFQTAQEVFDNENMASRPCSSGAIGAGGMPESRLSADNLEESEVVHLNF